MPFEIDAEETEEAKHTTVLSAQKRDKKPEETAGEEGQKDDDSVAAEMEPAVNTPIGRRTKFRSAAFSAGKCEDCNDKRYDAVAVIDLLASC